MTTHTLRTGKTLAQQYADLGAYDGYKPKPLDSLVILLAGDPGSGKSTLLESNPNLLRLDFDNAATSNPLSRCATVPAFGKTVGMDFYRTVHARLLDDAKRQAPGRPSVIAIDTVDRLVSYLIEELEKQREKSFYDMHGKEAWGMVYDRAIVFIEELHRAGYGVICTTHVGDISKDVRDSKGQVVEITEKGLTTQKGLLKRLKKHLDMSAIMVRSTKEITKFEDRKDRKGNIIYRGEGADRKPERIKVGVEERMIHSLVFEPMTKELANAEDAKNRVNLRGRVDLSHTEGWADFLAGYDKAVAEMRAVAEREAAEAA